MKRLHQRAKHDIFIINSLTNNIHIDAMRCDDQCPMREREKKERKEGREQICICIRLERENRGSFEVERKYSVERHQRRTRGRKEGDGLGGGECMTGYEGAHRNIWRYAS